MQLIKTTGNACLTQTHHYCHNWLESDDKNSNL